MSDPTPRAQGQRDERTAPRAGHSRSPVGSTLTIVLTVSAIAAGSLILRSIERDGAGSLPTTPATTPAGAGGTTTPGATAPGGSAVTAASGGATVTTVGGRVTDGGTVVVANASAVDGAAADMTEKLAAVEYSVGEPTNYTPDEDLEDTVVYFSVGVDTEAVARSVARDLGGVDVQPMPADPPVESLGNGSVLVVLGNDMANKDLVAGPPAVPSAPTSGAATTTD